MPGSKCTLWGFPPVAFSIYAINVQHPRGSVPFHILTDFLGNFRERKEASLGRVETKIDKKVVMNRASIVEKKNKTHNFIFRTLISYGREVVQKMKNFEDGVKCRIVL